MRRSPAWLASASSAAWRRPVRRGASTGLVHGRAEQPDDHHLQRCDDEVDHLEPERPGPLANDGPMVVLVPGAVAALASEVEGEAHAPEADQRGQAVSGRAQATRAGPPRSSRG